MKLSKKQKEAAELLQLGMPKKKVAALVGCDPSTLRRWLHQKAFIEYSQFLVDHLVEEDIETFTPVRFNTFDCLQDIRQAVLSRVRHLVSNPEDSSRNEIAILKVAGKWSGLESINDRVDMQLDYLERRMSPEAYEELLQALSLNSIPEVGMSNTVDV